MIKQCFSPCLLHLTGIPHLLPQFDTVQLHHISRRPVPPSIYSLVFLPRTALHSPEPCARCCCHTGWGSLLCKADRAEEKAEVKKIKGGRQHHRNLHETETWGSIYSG